MRSIALILLLSLLTTTAGAGTVSRLYDFEPDTPAEADKVDAEFDNIISTLNGNINSANILDGGIATADLATASVTHAKMAALGHQISSSSGNAYRNSDIEAAVSNLTANITVVSRPVWVGLQPAGGTSAPGRVLYRHSGRGATDNAAIISFKRVGSVGTAATVNQAYVGVRETGSTEQIANYPCGDFWFLDDPGAGPFNYTTFFRVATGDSGMLSVENCKLVVFEL